MTATAYPTKIEESRMMVTYYAKKVHGLIEAKRSFDAIGRVNSAWHPSSVGMWFAQWRRERRALAALLKSSAAQQAA